jgi:hypothetical protein
MGAYRRRWERLCARDDEGTASTPRIYPRRLWAYVKDVVPLSGRALLPDISDIVSHAARAVGTSRLGVPWLPIEQASRRTPAHGVGGALAAGAAGAFYPWAALLPTGPTISPSPPLADATSRDRLPLPLAPRIVKEAAIPMSKIDPRAVAGV